MRAADTELVIRHFVEDDRAVLIDLWVKTGLMGPGRLAPHGHIDAALNQNNCVLLIGIGPAGLIASIVVGHIGHRGWIYCLAVEPAQQQEGHGATMLAAAEAWLQQRAVSDVHLMIRPDNAIVQQFYDKQGWHTLPNIVMRKSLPEPS
jgi:ribosomal protein S18 acetylase RimI-like enzyme